MECNKNANVVSCPPCGENVGLPTKRGVYKVTSLISPSIGPADHFLRKGGRKGFTLIELLVVVLIIGILAAVAVPQYQKAVLKSRYTQAKTMATSLANAMEVYYLANNGYTSDIQKLDVSMHYTSTSISSETCQETSDKCYYYTDWGRCVLSSMKGFVFCMVEKENDALAYLRFLTHSTTIHSGKIYCRTQVGATVSDTTYKICQAETGNQTPSGSWPDTPSFLYQ